MKPDFHRTRVQRLAAVMRVMLFVALLACDACIGAAQSHSGGPLSDESLGRIQFDQKLNNPITLDLAFRDEAGKPVRLRDFFQGKPVILQLGYYGCPMLCTLVLNGLVESLQDLTLDPVDQFEIVSVSIDPKETPQLASAKKQIYLKRYGRRNADAGWHFLTGDEAEIKTLAEQIGFRYAYDPAIRQYAHPSGIVILTPQGKVSRYLFGINFSATELDAALKEASANKIGSRIEQLLLLCFHYSPIRGKYGTRILWFVRVSGVATMLALAGTLIVITRRQRESRETRRE